jgi:hypothetical protein
MGLYKNKPRNYEAGYKNIKPKTGITFGTLGPEGVTNVRVISHEVIQKCPLCILVPEHYKADGTCLCFDKDEQERIKRERLERHGRIMAAILRQKGTS